MRRNDAPRVAAMPCPRPSSEGLIVSPPGYGPCTRHLASCNERLLLRISSIMPPLAALFPFSCMAIWAGDDIVSKLALGLRSPTAMAWSRWLVAVLILTPFLARRP